MAVVQRSGFLVPEGVSLRGLAAAVNRRPVLLGAVAFAVALAAFFLIVSWEKQVQAEIVTSLVVTAPLVGESPARPAEPLGMAEQFYQEKIAAPISELPDQF